MVRLALASVLLLVAAAAVGQSALLKCSDDGDCPLERLCCRPDNARLALSAWDEESGADDGVCAAECSIGKNLRSKRSLVGVLRALGSVMSKLVRWYRRRGVGTTTSTGLRILTRRGGYRQAQKDFDAFLGKSDIAYVRSINGGGRVAIGKDGSRMIVRPRSSDGRPTLEFQNARGRAVLKYRYEP